VDPLVAALANPSNWKAEPPPSYVQIVHFSVPAADRKRVLLDPAGAATVVQRVVPLNTLIQKYEETLVDPPATMQVSVRIGGILAGIEMVKDNFALAQFQNFTDQQKLSLPSFELKDAGFRTGAKAVSKGPQSQKDLAYITKHKDTESGVAIGALYNLSDAIRLAMLSTGPVQMAQVQPPGPRRYLSPEKMLVAPALEPEKYVVVTTDALTLRTDITSPTSLGSAHEALEIHLLKNPDQRGALQIVPASEVPGA
jgi:hypothetical protein